MLFTRTRCNLAYERELFPTEVFWRIWMSLKTTNQWSQTNHLVKPKIFTVPEWVYWDTKSILSHNRLWKPRWTLHLSESDKTTNLDHTPFSLHVAMEKLEINTILISIVSEWPKNRSELSTSPSLSCPTQKISRGCEWEGAEQRWRRIPEPKVTAAAVYIFTVLCITHY